MGLTRSPLAPDSLPFPCRVKGVTLASINAGLRYKDRPDMLLVECSEKTVAVGVFTQSSTRAAPVDWCVSALKQTANIRALLVNAGQANCGVGEIGWQAIHQGTAAVAELVGCAQHQVVVASTGIIGQPIPLNGFMKVIAPLHQAQSQDGWEQAAQAIGTTDTYVKYSSRSIEIDGKPVHLQGIAKGSGMICPNMATLLAFVFTDAVIDAPVFNAMLHKAVNRSFNCITVDGDGSTNDSLLAFATAEAGNPLISDAKSEEAALFYKAFESLLIELAQLVVKDGEGAQKFITIHLSGAADDAMAHRLAMDIANSPLVKTAIAGADANWGRLLMAIGKRGEAIDKTKITIAFGSHEIARYGALRTDYDEAPVAAYMQGRAIELFVTVGDGSGKATVWTCDLTHGYIAINGDYRS